MNTEERITMVKSMDYIVSRLREPSLVEIWRTSGMSTEDVKNFGSLVTDAKFADLMDLFIYVIKHSRLLDGGLCCDGVVSCPQIF